MKEQQKIVDSKKRNERVGEGNIELDEDKLQMAIEAERARKKFKTTDLERGYNSLKGSSIEITEEELEAYRRERSEWNDPMAKYVDEEDKEEKEELKSKN